MWRDGATCRYMREGIIGSGESQRRKSTRVHIAILYRRSRRSTRSVYMRGAMGYPRFDFSSMVSRLSALLLSENAYPSSRLNASRDVSCAHARDIAFFDYRLNSENSDGQHGSTYDTTNAHNESIFHVVRIQRTLLWLNLFIEQFFHKAIPAINRELLTTSASDSQLIYVRKSIKYCV